MKADMKTLTSMDSEDWYTPAPIIALVREALGGRIDLDPASSLLANRTVQATNFFAKDDDGLSQPIWDAGTVFLNPPFGKIGSSSMAGIWIEQMHQRWLLGEFEEGIALTHTRCGYRWWEDMWRMVPTCMTREKIAFIPAVPRAAAGGSKTSQTFFFFGRNPDRFRKVFSPLGRVLMEEGA